MSKGQSVNRKFKRGHLVSVWNNTLKRPDFYRKLKTGGYMLSNPFKNNSAWGKKVEAKQIARYREQSFS